MASLTIEQAIEVAVRQHQAGRLAEAESLYRQVLSYQPNHSDALHLLGALLHQCGRNAEAVGLLRRAVLLNPTAAVYHNNLGLALAGDKQFDEAIAAYHRALELRPDDADAWNNLGTALKETGRLRDALVVFKQAITLRPCFPDALNNLGTALRLEGRMPEAIEAYQQAINQGPDHAEAHYNLGNAYRESGRLDDAVASYRVALALQPDFPGTWNNLGNALKDQAELDEAIASYRKAMALGGDAAASSLLSVLHYHPGYSPERIREEHARWNEKYARPLKAEIRPDDRDRDPHRPLRIGYVSPDFCNHPVGRFMLPLLSHHDRSQFQIICYSDVKRPDFMTERLRPHATLWRQTTRLSDHELADQIRVDQVDVLVDLAVHTGGNRLLAFARKPAPVQVTYLGYCGTTGLETIDYRLTDPYFDPPGADLACYSEKSVRLPQTYWCYQPAAEAPEVGPPPVLPAGHVTLGCLNNYCKVSEPALAVWCQLLAQTPNSELVLYAPEGSHRERARDRLARAGVDPGRLRFVGRVPLGQYLRQYHAIDIGLDPFPFAGGATTCDALFMGVPVISLAGQTAVSRAGLSILSNVGLPELVARSAEQYARIARDLAQDLPRLSELRATLRERMRCSPLMDAHRFARDIEAAYRHMWQAWCASGATPSQI